MNRVAAFLKNRVSIKENDEYKDFNIKVTYLPKSAIYERSTEDDYKKIIIINTQKDGNGFNYIVPLMEDTIEGLKCNLLFLEDKASHRNVNIFRFLDEYGMDIGLGGLVSGIIDYYCLELNTEDF